MIGDFQYKTRNWSFGVDGFHTNLVSNLQFQNLDKVEFPAAIDGTILRGYLGYKLFEKENKQNRFRMAVYPYGGIRFMDLRIYSENSNILDLKPSWVEPLVGVKVPIYLKRWLFEVRADLGGFSINNHSSGFAGLDASYRFSKLFGLGLGWAYMHLSLFKMLFQDLNYGQLN